MSLAFILYLKHIAINASSGISYQLVASLVKSMGRHLIPTEPILPLFFRFAVFLSRPNVGLGM